MSENRILLIDDRPIRRRRIVLGIGQVKNISIVGQMTSNMEIPTEFLVQKPNFLILSAEVAARCRAHSRKPNRHLKVPGQPVPLVLAGIRKLKENRDVKICQYDDNTTMQELITEVLGLQPEKTAAQIKPALRDLHDAVTTIPIVVIGASTGGVDALIKVVSKFPRACYPTFIVQHMKPSFVSRFAERLDRHCPAKVQEATNRAPVEKGKVYVAPAGSHLEIVQSSAGLQCRVFLDDAISGHMPSVDVLFSSLAKINGPKLGVLLTGMGRDGAEGLLKIKRSGGSTIGQNAETSIVYGMPKVAAELGAVDLALPIHSIGSEIVRLCKTLSNSAKVI